MHVNKSAYSNQTQATVRSEAHGTIERVVINLTATIHTNNYYYVAKRDCVRTFNSCSSFSY